MSLINYIQRAAVSDEALQLFIQRFNNKYNKTLQNRQALWLLGFNTHGELTEQKHLIRNQSMPSKVKECLVHHGFVRNTFKTEYKIVDGIKYSVPSLDESGKICYTSNLHPLSSLYAQHEVVTGDLSPEGWEDILDIGSLQYYNKSKDEEE